MPVLFRPFHHLPFAFTPSDLFSAEYFSNPIHILQGVYVQLSTLELYCPRELQ
jgi:hypothetical protein